MTMSKNSRGKPSTNRVLHMGTPFGECSNPVQAVHILRVLSDFFVGQFRFYSHVEGHFIGQCAGFCHEAAKLGF